MNKVELMALSYDLERAGRSEASALVDHHLNLVNTTDVTTDVKGFVCASRSLDSLRTRCGGFGAQHQRCPRVTCKGDTHTVHNKKPPGRCNP